MESGHRIVYRADTRPPQIIFAQGFHPRGENDNLLEHVQGVSLGEHGDEANSAYVATTSHRNVALGIGSSEPAFYLYEIMPTNNFYKVTKSFSHYATIPGQRAYLNAVEEYRHQHEYVAFAGIAKEQIIQATHYLMIHGAPVARNPPIRNHHFRRVNGSVNPGPYPYWYPYGL